MDKNLNIISNFIDGRIANPKSSNLGIFDPSKGEIISKVILSNKDDFNEVLNSSKKPSINGCYNSFKEIENFVKV